MTPEFQVPNIQNRDMRHLKHAAQHTSGNILTATYHHDLLSGQFRPGHVFTAFGFHQAQSVRMRDIFGARAVLQILDAIIRWIAIDVIHFFAIRARTDECSGNKTMDLSLSLSGIAAQVHRQVPTLTMRRRNDSTDVRSVRGLHALDTSQIRYLIPTFKTNRLSPFFGHSAMLPPRAGI